MEIREIFHSITLQRKYYFDELLIKHDLNLMELEILVFLYEFPKSNTLTAIFKTKGFAKSHVSNAISNLVQRGYVLKETSDTNKKVHNLTLVEISHNVINDYYSCVNLFRKDAFLDISQQEIEIFEQVVCKISKNLQKKEEN